MTLSTKNAFANKPKRENNPAGTSNTKNALAAIKTPDADTYYLTAVLGARTDNASLIYDGLKNAIKLDPSMATKAAKDLEFVKYLTDSSFLNIVK